MYDQRITEVTLNQNICTPTLPVDIIMMICKYLGVVDINSLSFTNSTFHNVIAGNSKYIYSICKHIKPHGRIVSWWDADKTINKSDIYYSEGKKNGTYNLWHANGTLSDQCSFIMGKKHGLSTCWHINGRMSELKTYANGVLNGMWKCWYDNGQICDVFNYSEGKLHGESKEWYYNGQISDRSFFLNGELYGECKRWYLNGQISDHRFYVEGCIVKCEKWSDDGQVIYV